MTHDGDESPAGRSQLWGALAIALFLTVAGTDSLLGGAPQEAQEQSTAVLWNDARRTEAKFVPAILLESLTGEIDDDAGATLLPLTKDQRAILSLTLAGAQSSDREACTVGVTGDAFTAPSAPDSLSLDDLVLAAPITLVARVLDVVPGWSTILRSPATLVYVRPEAVIHPQLDVSAIPEIVSYLQQSGTISIAGARLCLSEPGGHTATVGETVLLIGGGDRHNPAHLDKTLVLSVIEDALVVEGHSVLRRANLTLKSLRQRVWEHEEGAGNVPE